MLKLRAGARRDIPVVMTAASEGRGITDLHAAIDRLLQTTSGESRRDRKRRVRLLIAQTAAGLARRLVLEPSDVRIAALVDAAARGEITIEAAAAKAVGGG
jgi:putative protein kinase ArgK-like GTPase of G3E family